MSLTPRQFQYSEFGNATAVGEVMVRSSSPGVPVSAEPWISESRAILCYSRGFFIVSLDGNTFVQWPQEIVSCAFDEPNLILWIHRASTSPSVALVGFDIESIMSGSTGDTTIGPPLDLTECAPPTRPATAATASRILIANDVLTITCTDAVGYVDLRLPVTDREVILSPPLGPRLPVAYYHTPGTFDWYFLTLSSLEKWRWEGPGTTPAITQWASLSPLPVARNFIQNPASGTLYWYSRTGARALKLLQLGASDSAFTAEQTSLPTIDFNPTRSSTSFSIPGQSIDPVMKRLLILITDREGLEPNVTSKIAVATVRFGNCNAAATDCETCLAARDAECGWCPNESGTGGTCGAASECPLLWFPTRCPALKSAMSASPLVTGLPFVFQLDAYPFLGANVTCSLRSPNNDSLPVPVIQANEALCGITASTDSLLPKLAGSYNLEVGLNGVLTLPSPIPISFLNCSSITTCSQCTSSGSCDWCVYDGACVNSATDCSIAGPPSQRPSKPLACPIQGPITPNTTITPPPSGTAVSIQATNLIAPPPNTGSLYTCRFELPSLSTPFVSSAVFVSAASGVQCSVPTPPGNAVGKGSLTLQLNGHRFADNSNQFTFYDCTAAVFGSCQLCLDASNALCGWKTASASCGLASSCTTADDCKSACPMISSISPSSFHVTQDVGAQVTITGTYFTASSPSTWRCDFGFDSSPATRVSETQITCNAPTFSNTGYFTPTQSLYETNLTLLHNNKVYSAPVHAYWYDCIGSTCSTCLNNDRAPKCRWDFDSFSCGDQTSSGSAQCPTIKHLSDTAGHVEGYLDLIIEPQQAPAGGLNYRCAWTDFSNPAVPRLDMPATLSGGNWSCSTPNITGYLTSSQWSHAITSKFWIEAETTSNGWKAYTAEPRSFVFYDCRTAPNCTTCLASSQCVWADYDSCAPESDNPPGVIISGQCPRIVSISSTPHRAVEDTTVTVKVENVPFPGTNYFCLWLLPSGASIRAPVTMTDSTTINCLYTRTFRDLNFAVLDFRLMVQTKPLSENSLPFEVYNCPVAQTCSECSQVHPMCGWCSDMGSCADQAACTGGSDWTTSDCPYVASIVPPYAAIGAAPRLVSLQGSFNPSVALTCRFTLATSEVLDVQANVTAQTASCLLPSITEKTSIKIQLGILVNDTLKRTILSSTRRSIMATSFVPLVPNEYQFDFFSCSNSSSSAASCRSCTTEPDQDSRCGWCAFDATCGDQYSCNSNYPYWANAVAQCPAVREINPGTGPLKGGTEVTITGSVFFPGIDGTACRFGTQVVAAKVASATTVKCISPTASSLGIKKNGVSVQVSVMWRNAPFTSDANQLSFTYKNADTSTKIIIGVVVGLCLLVLLVLLILFLLFYRRIKEARYRRRFLKLEEPDYAAISAIQTSALELFVSPSDLKSLASFIRLLEADTSYHIVSAIASSVSTSESDSLARAIIFFYQSRGRALDLLLAFVTAEVRVSEHEGTLFRASSFACKLFNQYARYNCLPYLWLTLGYYVNQLAEFAREERTADREDILGPGSMEIDPDRFEEENGMPSEIGLRLNQYELLTRASKVLKSIFGSTGNMPPQLRHFFATVKQQVAAKFHDNNADYKAVGGFVFLRLLCPAIVAPHVYGLLGDSPNETAQRYFVLIAKTLQNLANETLPGTNEDFMIRINEFITKNIQPLHGWVDEVCDSTPPNKPEGPVADSVANSSVAFIQNTLVKEWDRVSQNLPEDTVSDLERVVEKGPLGKKPQNKKKGDHPPRRK